MARPLPIPPMHRRALWAALLLSGSAPLAAQGQPEKEINEQAQVWLSVNGTARFSDRWGAAGDFHIRRNDFLRDPSRATKSIHDPAGSEE
jgi:hypothetical protein